MNITMQEKKNKKTSFDNYLKASVIELNEQSLGVEVGDPGKRNILFN